jgi:hypothetical protein
MQPSELKAEQFSGYPPQAKEMAVTRIALLQQLPVCFVALLLRELIAYDWKFPPERKDLNRQLAYLELRSAGERRKLMESFERLRLSPELQRFDWVNAPGQFSEQLTAHLWATHQIDAFRAAAMDYMKKATAAAPPEPLPMARLAIVVVGQGVSENQYRLFRKLRPHGVYCNQVKAENGFRTLLDAVAARAKAHPLPYGHWYIDGGTEQAIPGGGFTCLSYNSLTPARTALQDKMQKAFQSGMAPEALRTMLAEMRPVELGLGGAADGVLSRFQVSLLTEGSGTQVFSTTFVQWAAREVLRRAQPVTLLARFAPRQRARPMNELLAESQRKPELDPQGSLVDADMGAYYTWLNQQRLEGAEQSSFLVWFEDHHEALAIGPALPRATESNGPVELEHLVRQVAV